MELGRRRFGPVCGPVERTGLRFSAKVAPSTSGTETVGSCTGREVVQAQLRSLPRTWPAGPKSHVCQISAYVKGTPPPHRRGTKVFGTNAPVARQRRQRHHASAPTSACRQRRPF